MISSSKHSSEEKILMQEDEVACCGRSRCCKSQFVHRLLKHFSVGFAFLFSGKNINFWQSNLFGTLFPPAIQGHIFKVRFLAYSSFPAPITGWEVSIRLHLLFRRFEEVLCGLQAIYPSCSKQVFYLCIFVFVYLCYCSFVYLPICV